MNGKIYSIRNKVNGKMYIGQTIGTVTSRISSHFCARKNGSPLLVKSIKKYGKDSFEFFTLCSEIESREELDLAEDFYIWYYRTIVPSGMNLKGGGTSGYVYTEDTRLKISHGIRNSPNNNDRKKGMSERMKALASTDEWKKSRSVITKKRFENKAQRDLSREIMRKIANDPECIRKSKENRAWAHELRKKPVYCVDNGRIFESIQDAAKYTGTSSPGMTASVMKGHKCVNRNFQYLMEKDLLTIHKTIEETDSRRCKQIICVETGEIYSSAEDAIRKGISNVRLALNKGKTAHGYHWKFYTNSSMALCI